MIKKDIIWATKKLREGKKVRRIQWIDGAYLCMDELSDIISGWDNSKTKENRDLCFADLEGEDWIIK